MPTIILFHSDASFHNQVFTFWCLPSWLCPSLHGLFIRTPARIIRLHYLIWYTWDIVHVVNLSWQGFSAVCARSGPYPFCTILPLTITMARKGCFELLAELPWGKREKWNPPRNLSIWTLYTLSIRKSFFPPSSHYDLQIY